MLYRPPDPTLGLWDTWLYREGDTIHLFHLQARRGEMGCSSIGHATTRDWLHWETLPPALEQGHGTAWDAGPLMTGMVLPHDGRYYMFYGAMVDRIQRIGLAVSDDLLHWDKLGSGPVLEAAGPWYETDPVRALNYETAWRDPYVFFHAPDRCYYAFICARAANGGDTGGGCVAVARSETLLDWTLLPPAYVSDRLTCLEVPEYLSLGDKHFITYTTSYHFGTPYPAADPYQATGTFYLVSDEMLGGYQIPPHDNALNASAPIGNTNYVGRSIPDPARADRRLFYYQHVLPASSGQVPQGSLSAIKYLEADGAGRLRLRYAPLLEPHAEKQASDGLPDPDQLLAPLAEDAPDGIFEATVTAPYAGICFRMGQDANGSPAGLAVWLSPRQAGGDELVLLLGGIHFPPGPAGHRPFFSGPLALSHLDEGTLPHRLRVVCRDSFVDVYVDDVLRLSHTLGPANKPDGAGVGAFYAGHPKTGAVEHAIAYRLETQPTVNDPGR